MNTSLLTNSAYRQDIKQTIQSVIQENSDMEVDKLWELLKYKVKRKMHFHLFQSKKKIKIKCDAIAQDIERIQAFLTEHPDDITLKNQLADKEAELQLCMHEEHVRGILVRTRATWISIAEGENTHVMFLI